ncbi:homeobox protein BEL1 homolog isoform X2 [Amborella trichopoda]|nr:homeobox protein BEL1 homolog isoform X2 [Amborella trichopoda]|eukprot:XP_011629004.1 homeobox protein BEL1 homolog isoform X2 [Amborella trichopoda]
MGMEDSVLLDRRSLSLRSLPSEFQQGMEFRSLDHHHHHQQQQQHSHLHHHQHPQQALVFDGVETLETSQMINHDIFNLELLGFQSKNNPSRVTGVSMDGLSTDMLQQLDHPQSNQSPIGENQFILQNRFLDSQSNASNIWPTLSLSSEKPMLEIKNSRYLVPAQKLLYEFCNLGSKRDKSMRSINGRSHGVSTSANMEPAPSVYSSDLFELQKRKVKLVSMLDEVDKRYKQYCERMRSVASSFEAVAGAGAAHVYLGMASRAMSRHFRCLRDGIVAQLRATRVALGEKEAAVMVSLNGATRGETPSLKLVDQRLRRQRALQQMGMMEAHPWRPQRGLPERSVSLLRAWLFEHFLHPYPSDVDKHILARQTGLSRSQVSNWFINARVRLWKPMVEEMYLEEAKEDIEDRQNPNPNSNSPFMPSEPNATAQDRDSESLSSIVISDTKDQVARNLPELGFPYAEDDNSSQRHFSGMFPSEDSGQRQFSGNYTEESSVQLQFSGNYSDENSTHRQISMSGEGVSLTLGLQQGGAMNFGFSSNPQNPLLFLEGEDHGTGFGSQMGGYRNLVGGHLMRDYVG